MVGSLIGFDTSGLRIEPSLLREFHNHQRGVNTGLRKGLFSDRVREARPLYEPKSPIAPAEQPREVKEDKKKQKKKKTKV